MLWAHGTVKHSGSPVSPAYTTSASRTQCASQFMPDQHATLLRHPKTLLLSQKPGMTVPFPCNMHCSGAEGACRVTWCLPTRLNAKRHHGLTETFYWLRADMQIWYNQHKRRQGGDWQGRSWKVKVYIKRYNELINSMISAYLGKHIPKPTGKVLAKWPFLKGQALRVVILMQQP